MKAGSRMGRFVGTAIVVVVLQGCTMRPPEEPFVPATDYVQRLRANYTPPKGDAPRARFVAGTSLGDTPDRVGAPLPAAPEGAPQVYPLDTTPQPVPSLGQGRDYTGPLRLGDPGVSASLWHESSSAADLFHDLRAFQPMDLVTILITESTEGSKAADTKLDSKSSFQAAIEKLFGLDNLTKVKNPTVDPTALLNATAESKFDGKGETTRKGKLKGTLSAMVAEVLPTGILRVAGEKIISVNGEEQVMILSGLVRPRDINSDNEVDSSKIANMRIDYFGKGVVGEMQYPGWLTRIIRAVWPF